MSLKREKVLKGPSAKEQSQNSFIHSVQKNRIKIKTILWRTIHAPKVPFNFHFKIGMKNDIFVYLNFDSKLKIEKRQFHFISKY